MKAAQARAKAQFEEPKPSFTDNEDFFAGYKDIIDLDSTTRGMLTICPTPIGNLMDLSARQFKALRSLDILACEDTRVTGKLLEIMKQPLKEYTPESARGEDVDEFSLCSDFYDHTLNKIKESRRLKDRGLLVTFNSVNQQIRAPKLIKSMKMGLQVGLISDAGTPCISDPGGYLVQQAIQNNISVEALPGPNAGITALSASGFPADNFFFAGYLSKTDSEREAKLEKARRSGTTCVLYESVHRIEWTLENINMVYGNFHEIFVARELTKLHERHYRGTVLDIIREMEREKAEGHSMLGELTIVIAPQVIKQDPNPETITLDLKELVDSLYANLQTTPKNFTRLLQIVTKLPKNHLRRLIKETTQVHVEDEYFDYSD